MVYNIKRNIKAAIRRLAYMTYDKDVLQSNTSQYEETAAGFAGYATPPLYFIDTGGKKHFGW